MLARYYSPSGTFRFASVDPGDDTYHDQPQSWNKYAYVRNSPLGLIDQNGEAAEEANQLLPQGDSIVLNTMKALVEYFTAPLADPVGAVSGTVGLVSSSLDTTGQISVAPTVTIPPDGIPSPVDVTLTGTGVDPTTGEANSPPSAEISGPSGFGAGADAEGRFIVSYSQGPGSVSVSTDPKKGFEIARESANEATKEVVRLVRDEEER